MIATYDPRLVVLSVVIAVIASYTALDLAGRIAAANGRARSLWLAGGAIAMGTGIWSMHFIAMLAYNLPVPIDYDSSIVFASLAVAVFASGLALYIVSLKQVNSLQFLAGGSFMGGAITAMHYTGMAAMQLEARSKYDLVLVALSFVIAIGASVSALRLTFHLRRETTSSGSWLKLGSALLMGCAIAGMHYIAMTAVCFESTNPLLGTFHHTERTKLAVAIGIATLIILVALQAAFVARRLKIEEALRQTEAKYRSIFENAVEGIFQTTPDGYYISANPALARIYGYESPEKLIAGLLSIEQQLYVEPNRRAEFMRLMQQHDAVSGFEAHVYRQDGSTIWISENARAVRDASGALLCYEGTVEDITSRKQAADELELRVEERTAELRKTNEQLQSEIVERQRAEEALRKSLSTNRALLNAIPDLMFRISSDGTFVNYKVAKDNNLLLPPSKFLGKNLYEVLPPEVAMPTMYCVERALQTGEIQIFEYQLLVNNNLHDYEARLVVSAEDEVIAMVRDITERKRAEADIRNALEKEKQLSELKSRFVTMASHEFRTPLTTILSSAELLQDYGFKWNEEKKLQHLQRVVKAVKHMTQLLNDVLLIGKAEAGKLECNPAPLQVAEFCRELVDEMQLGFDTHTIAFCSESKCTTACMDEKLLRHILSNLLSNAIKYSARGGTVHFDLVCEQQQAIFRVQDRGIGIPKVEQAQLFDSFHRATNVGNIPGTGLGLAIVKKSVDLHGGTITVESEVGVGTTFTVTLPLNKQVKIDA